MLVVRELHRAGQRLPFGIEVVGFSEEECQRFPADFLSASTLVGTFDPAWLDGVKTVGLTAGASAPEVLVEGVVAALAERFELTVIENGGARETMAFKLPKVLTD